MTRVGVVAGNLLKVDLLIVAWGRLSDLLLKHFDVLFEALKSHEDDG